MKRYIRIFVLLAAALPFFASCINSDDITGGYGKIKFSISHNSSVSVKGTTVEAPDNFVVSTTDANNVKVDDLSGQYADFKRQEVIVPVGTYFIEAYNVTEEKAEEGRGVQRFFGSDTLEVAASSVNFADFTCFSFHAVKNLTTAEGGALTWKAIPGVDDEWLYKQFQLLSLHGQNKDALAKTQLGAWEYDIVAPNYKCNMTDIMAAIGLMQMKRYPGMLARRREIIERYNRGLENQQVEVLNHYGENHSSSGHLYLVRLTGKDVDFRNNVITRMAERGIACNVHYKPLPMMTAYKNLGFDIDDYPNAYNQYHNEVSLPLHTCLTDEQVDYVIENFIEIINN